MNRRERDETGRRLVAHRTAVIAWLRSFGVSENEREDAAQTVFMYAVARWHDYRPAEPLGGWLYGVTKLVAANWHRTRRRHPVDPVDQMDGIGVRSHEERAIARAELAALPEHLAPLLHALAGNGFMLAPAARDLHVDEDTIRVRLVSIRHGLPVEPLIRRPKRQAAAPDAKAAVCPREERRTRTTRTRTRKADR